MLYKPTTSIITPTHNSAAYIRDTLDAILAQTYEDWELLITDDASADYTCQIVEEYMKKDPRISLYRLSKNCGAAVARNESIKHASGRFIAFCDSDDVWTPDKLEKQIAFMTENGHAFTFAPYHIIDEAGNLLDTTQTRDKVSYNDILLTCDIGCLTAVYDTDKLGKVYMPLIRKRQDYALWLRLLKVIEHAHSYPEPLGYYRLRRHSISSNKFKAIWYIWKVYRGVEKLPLCKSVYLVIIYSIYGIKKYRRLKTI
jgi:teichuronic acid biosynthesis glycosyltransferase TuaG